MVVRWVCWTLGCFMRGDVGRFVVPRLVTDPPTCAECCKPMQPADF